MFGDRFFEFRQVQHVGNNWKIRNDALIDKHALVFGIMKCGWSESVVFTASMSFVCTIEYYIT